MANENNCNPWETTPDYTIELNEQGPPGKKGDKGDDGYSPTITVYKNTEDEYVLNIINKDSNFITPNLYGNKEWAEQDLENTPLFGRIRADVLGPTTETNITMANVKNNMEGVSDYNLALNNLVVEENNSDITLYPYSPQTSASATTLTLTIDGDEDSFNTVDKPYLTIDKNSKIISNAYEYIFQQQEHSLASTVKIECNTELTKSDTVTATYGGKEIATVDDVATVDNKLANKLEASNIIAGDNITLDVDGNNITINSTGGGEVPDNYVTTDTVQTITGSKTFSATQGPAISLPSLSNITLGNEANNQYIRLIQNAGTSEIRFGSTIENDTASRKLVVLNNSPDDIYYNNNKLLTSADIDTTVQPKLTAGEGITIQDNVISSTTTGGGDVIQAGNNNFTGSNTFNKQTKFIGEAKYKPAILNIGTLQVGSTTETQTLSNQINLASNKGTNKHIVRLQSFADSNSGNFQILGYTGIDEVTDGSTPSLQIAFDQTGFKYQNNSMSQSFNIYQELVDTISTISQLQETITSLTSRIQALENNINGGNA